MAVFHWPLQEDSEAICVGGIGWQVERAGAGFERAKRDHAAGLICDAELVTNQCLCKPFFQCYEQPCLIPNLLKYYKKGLHIKQAA